MPGYTCACPLLGRQPAFRQGARIYSTSLGYDGYSQLYLTFGDGTGVAFSDCRSNYTELDSTNWQLGWPTISSRCQTPSGQSLTRAQSEALLTGHPGTVWSISAFVEESLVLVFLRHRDCDCTSLGHWDPACLVVSCEARISTIPSPMSTFQVTNARWLRLLE
jgi:hypothetical protein